MKCFSRVAMAGVFVAVAVAVLTMAGCAARQRHISTVAAVSTHEVLSTLQDTEMTLVCGRAGAPPAGQCVPQDVHQQISARLASAFEYDKAVALTIRDWPVSSPPPASLGENIARIADAIDFVFSNIPESPFKERLRVLTGQAKK